MEEHIQKLYLAGTRTEARTASRRTFMTPPTQHTLSHGCPTDVILGYRNNHKIS